MAVNVMHHTCPECDEPWEPFLHRLPLPTVTSVRRISDPFGAQGGEPANRRMVYSNLFDLVESKAANPIRLPPEPSQATKRMILEIEDDDPANDTPKAPKKSKKSSEAPDTVPPSENIKKELVLSIPIALPDRDYKGGSAEGSVDPAS